MGLWLAEEEVKMESKRTLKNVAGASGVVSSYPVMDLFQSSLLQ